MEKCLSHTLSRLGKELLLQLLRRLLSLGCILRRIGLRSRYTGRLQTLSICAVICALLIPSLYEMAFWVAFRRKHKKHCLSPLLTCPFQKHWVFF